MPPWERTQRRLAGSFSSNCRSLCNRKTLSARAVAKPVVGADFMPRSAGAARKLMPWLEFETSTPRLTGTAGAGRPSTEEPLGQPPSFVSGVSLWAFPWTFRIMERRSSIVLGSSLPSGSWPSGSALWVNGRPSGRASGSWALTCRRLGADAATGMPADAAPGTSGSRVGAGAVAAGGSTGLIGTFLGTQP